MKTVMIFGTFDLVHFGHIQLFKQARKYGDNLILVLARDERVQKLKKKLPIHTEQERKKFLETIRLIDQVVLGDKTDVYKKIKEFKPDTIVLGYDQKFFVDDLAGQIQKFGLKTKIVTATAYQPERLKTSLIRKK